MSNRRQSCLDENMHNVQGIGEDIPIVKLYLKENRMDAFLDEEGAHS